MKDDITNPHFPYYSKYRNNILSLPEATRLAQAEAEVNQSKGDYILPDDITNLKITLGCANTVEELLATL